MPEDSSAMNNAAGHAYVLVIGSASVDVSVMTAALPQPGETVIGHGSLIAPGGKGSNQAVAAVACGAATHFVGRTGADAFGGMIRQGLAERGVQIGELRALADVASGLATISVEDSGKNAIVVVPGSNGRLMPGDLDPIATLIGGAAVVVLQCEIPMDTVYRAIELSHAAAVPVILNPAPFRGLDLARAARGVTYLVPNETEASQLWGAPVETLAQAETCASWLHAQGIPCVVITLGAKGCMVAGDQAARHYDGHRVTAVDTTGAGDAFVGCLAASLASGRSREESIQRALLYSALSVTARGAQVSFPQAVDFERAWQAHAAARTAAS
jgi:ribokinase